MNNMQELCLLIDRADALYYNTGKIPVPDATYDGWKVSLKSIDPENVRLKRVGAAVAAEFALETRAHRFPMGSLDKAQVKGEYDAWASGFHGALFHASLKMDGSSIATDFEAGRLTRAVTRGDGIWGQDITANAMKFRGLPKFAVNPDGSAFSGGVRGEATRHACSAI